MAAAIAALTLGVLGAQGAAVAASGPGGTPAAGATSGASAHSSAPAAAKSKPAPRAPMARIAQVSCTPARSCSSNPHQVSARGTLVVQGVGLRAGLIVAFPQYPGARIGRYSPLARLRQSGSSLLVTVPASAHSGRIIVLLGHGHYTSPFGPITVFAHPLHPPTPPPPPPPSAPVSFTVGTGGLEGQGMWIWYVGQSNGGSIASIVAQAHAAAVATVFVKSSDGSSNYWGQFSPALVKELHANGLKVCAWQYVYGSNPAGEAALGAEAVANGADCLVIDAESEYEGHYAAAQTYITDLRAQIGPSYPVALASFPYVYYHESFPYSVFLGPGGAQFNAPQMYWKAIGQSVDTVYANTYIANRIYGRPIFPLGQTYESASSSELLRFREEAVDYGAKGVSFWDWQETGAAGWRGLAAPLAPLTSVIPNTTYPELGSGGKGDQVLWMQEHLATAIPAQETSGNFSAATVANLKAFQTAHSIPPSGVTDAATWAALLALAPVPVHWTGAGPAG